MGRITFIVFFFSLGAFAQVQTERISLSFEEQPIATVFAEIAAKSGFQFFYAEEWLAAQSISKTYENESIESIVEDLLADTDLNFFIDGKNIILTQQKVIYDTLPEDFFGSQSDSLENQAQNMPNVTPVLIEKNETTSRPIGTVTIGKANRNRTQGRYELSGRIIEVDTQKPISDAAIVVKNSNLGTTSDNQGNYSIALPTGVNHIEVSSLGYRKNQKNVILYNDGSLDFYMEELREELEEVVVEAEALSNIESTTTGSASIDSEKSKNIPLVLGERNVLKVATTLPGISTAGEGSAGFNVRGGKSDQNLILLDDAIIYNPTHFFGLFQALNPNAIGMVDIYKGSIPVEYGGRLSSVFDINTRRLSNEKISGEVAVGPVTANAVVEIPILKEKAGILVGGRAAYSDWVLRSLKDAELQNSQASFYDAILKYDHKIDDGNEVLLTGYYSKDNFSITSDSLFGYSNTILSAKWNHKFNDKNSGTMIANTSTYDFEIDYDGGVNNNFIQQFRVSEAEVKLRFNYLHSDTHQFGYGVSTKLYNIRPGEITPRGPNDLVTPISIAEEKGLESALFLSDRYTINEKLLINLGFRYSFYTFLGPTEERIYQDGVPKSDNTVIGTESFENNAFVETYGGPQARVSLRYLLQEDLSVKASFDNTYQFIHTLSNNTTLSPIDTWKLSDTHIKPQRANQFSMGVYKNININEYELSVEGFYKRQKNVLDFKTGAQLLLNENVETEVLQGDGKSYGVEFLAKKNIGKLNGWLGYTYSRSFFRLDSEFTEERVNDGRFFPSNFDKPHDLSLVLNYKVSRRVSFSSNFVYQTGRPVTFPVGNYTLNGSNFVLYSDRNQFRIPDYYRLDLGINIEGNHKKNKLFHSFWSVSVYNVLGRNNPYSVFFVTEEGEVKALQSSIFKIPVPSITYNFRF